MSYTFFSHLDLDKLATYTAETRGFTVADVEKLVDEVETHVVAPLKTLNQNRPGNENNQKALEEAAMLCSTMKGVLASVKVQDITPSEERGRTTALGA